jgi:homocysteine S-methyltransferase
MNRNELRQRLADSILVGDGAMGTYIYTKGVPPGKCYEQLNLTQPYLVSFIHKEYIDAGASLVETNTFQANRFHLEQHELGDKVAEINAEAARIAVEVADGRVIVAGSVGPLAGSPVKEQPHTAEEKREAFREQILALASGGVDIIALETFSNLDDLLLALDVVNEETDLAAICSMTFSENGHTVSGVHASDAIQQLDEAGAAVIGGNCGHGPLEALHVVEQMAGASDAPIAAFPNAGFPEYREGRYHYLATPEYLSSMAKKMVMAGANLVGGCCGTTPEDIRQIHASVSGLKPFPRTRVTLPRTKEPTTGVITVDRSKWSYLDKVGTETSIIVEIDPPKTLNYEKTIAGAKRLKEVGVDAISVGDNPLAIQRMANDVMASMIEHEADISTIVHCACRDRNLIGTQSYLMGVAAQGLSSVLAITGDPAKVGPQTGASSVYDLNSFKLIEVLSKFNEGRTLSDHKLGKKTNFKIGVAYNPNVKNQEVQVKRLEKKIALGADYAMTQPVFDVAKVEETYEATKHLDIPIFLGIFPLMNSGNAEFLHNEVPGIKIPQDVRDRMAAVSREDGLAVGIECAKEVIAVAMDCFPGIYLIPPFCKASIAVELVEFINEEKVRRGQVAAAVTES